MVQPSIPLSDLQLPTKAAQSCKELHLEDTEGSQMEKAFLSVILTIPRSDVGIDQVVSWDVVSSSF